MVFLLLRDNFVDSLENPLKPCREILATFVQWAARRRHAMLIEEIYDALIEAGASEPKARAAAKAMTNYDSRISKIESDINLLKWMTGFNIALTVAILFRVFS